MGKYRLENGCLVSVEFCGGKWLTEEEIHRRKQFEARERWARLEEERIAYRQAQEEAQRLAYERLVAKQNARPEAGRQPKYNNSRERNTINPESIFLFVSKQSEYGLNKLLRYGEVLYHCGSDFLERRAREIFGRHDPYVVATSTPWNCCPLVGSAAIQQGIHYDRNIVVTAFFTSKETLSKYLSRFNKITSAINLSAFALPYNNFAEWYNRWAQVAYNQKHHLVYPDHLELNRSSNC